MPQSFAEVEQTEIGVDTVQFLEAVDGLVKMFGERQSVLTTYSYANQLCFATW